MHNARTRIVTRMLENSLKTYSKKKNIRDLYRDEKQRRYCAEFSIFHSSRRGSEIPMPHIRDEE